MVDKKPNSAFVLYVNGQSLQGKETMGRELGTILETEIPSFLVELGKTVAESGLTFAEWNAKDAEAIDRIAASYVK